MSAEIFDRRLRRIRRDRAAPRAWRLAELWTAVGDELVARLRSDERRYRQALVLGCGPAGLARKLPAASVLRLDSGAAYARGGVQADEDRLPFAEHSFDLVASVCALQSVNDLPGCLAQVRRGLRPGGRFVAVFPGGETLAELRRALIEAEELLTGGVSPRVHPMVDPREAPALLQRAGFAAPVVDVERLRLRYRDLFALVGDLRAAGETRLLCEPARPLTRTLVAAAAARFADQCDPDGRTTVTVELIHMAADAPG